MKPIGLTLRIKRSSLITGFRFLLWWGAETMRSIVSIPASKKEIQFVHLKGSWPISSWSLIEREPHCLVHEPGIPEIRIIAFPKIQMN